MPQEDVPRDVPLPGTLVAAVGAGVRLLARVGAAVVAEVGREALDDLAAEGAAELAVAHAEPLVARPDAESLQTGGGRLVGGRRAVDVL